MKPQLLLPVLLVLCSAACTSPASPGTSGPLRVIAQNSALVVENQSADPVFFLVYERQAAAVINWAPCVTQACPSIGPGARTILPYAAIGGYAPGKTEAIVWWWRAVPGPADAPVPGPVTGFVIAL